MRTNATTEAAAPENLLTAGLGAPLGKAEVFKRLAAIPPRPGDSVRLPVEQRVHRMMDVRDLHIPTRSTHQVQQTVDLMLRYGYRHRDPTRASTWAVISGEARHYAESIVPAQAAAVGGISGVGKTEACRRSLALYPQVIEHRTFPRLAGGLKQVVWLSVEMPASGRAIDLGLALMRAFDEATNGDRFKQYFSARRIISAERILNEWRQVACAHFLGLLHIDEVQNLFRLRSVAQRRSRQGNRSVPELAIVEDQALRWLVSLTNTGQIPLLVSGTPDGLAALTQRLATLSRVVSAGYIDFSTFSSPDEERFTKGFLEPLSSYQYTPQRLPLDAALATKVFELTAGVPRLIIALWTAAHRCAFERGGDDLKLTDFDRAARTYLRPLVPAVAAILSKNPEGLSRYEDLAQGASSYWSEFWSGQKPRKK